MTPWRTGGFRDNSGVTASMVYCAFVLPQPCYGLDGALLGSDALGMSVEVVRVPFVRRGVTIPAISGLGRTADSMRSTLEAEEESRADRGLVGESDLLCHGTYVPLAGNLNTY